MVSKFLDLLYHSIVPRKPQESVKESIDSYRYDVHYQKPLSPLGSAGKYMSHEYNRYCSDVGAQVTVMMDPSDFNKLFAIKNVSDHDIKADYHDGKNEIIGPGEHIVFKINTLAPHDPWHGIPRLTVLPNGNR